MIGFLLITTLSLYPLTDTIYVDYNNGVYMGCKDEQCDLKSSLPDGIYAVHKKVGYISDLRIIAQFKDQKKHGMWQYFAQNLYVSAIDDTVITRVKEKTWVEFEYEYNSGYLRHWAWYYENGNKRW